MTSDHYQLALRHVMYRIDQGNTQHVISGTAVVFNQPSSPMPFVEVISGEAFNGVDLSDVKLLYSHDFGNILARTDSGTLQLDLNSNGLVTY